MQGYRKIHAAKVKVARRKLRHKQSRWRGKTITRGSGRKQLTAPRRKHMNVSRMRKHG